MRNQLNLKIVESDFQARTVADIEEEIRACKRLLARAEKDFWKAVEVLTKHGHLVKKTVADSHGETRTVPGVNPAARIRAEADKTIRATKKLLATLEKELAARRAPPEGDFGFLDK